MRKRGKIERWIVGNMNLWRAETTYLVYFVCKS